MADRVLVWYLDGHVQVGTQQQQSYILDSDYQPTFLRLIAKRAPTGTPLKVNINLAGSTILTNQAQLDAGTTTGTRRDFNTVRMARGSLITLDVTQTGSAESGENLTVALELRRL